MTTKFEIDNLILEEKQKYNAWEYPTDRFMKELTLGIFENLILEAGVGKRGNESVKVYREKLEEMIEFANNEKDNWWSCLEEFCPTIDRNKIKRKIINTATATLEKIK